MSFLEIESGELLELEDGAFLELEVGAIFLAGVPNKFTSRSEGHSWISDTAQPFTAPETTSIWPADQDKAWL